MLTVNVLRGVALSSQRMFDIFLPGEDGVPQREEHCLVCLGKTPGLLP